MTLLLVVYVLEHLIQKDDLSPECTTDTDTPHVGCTVPECTSGDDPFVGCLCAGTFNPEGCIRQECNTSDSDPHPGCLCSASYNEGTCVPQES